MAMFNSKLLVYQSVCFWQKQSKDLDVHLSLAAIKYPLKEYDS